MSKIIILYDCLPIAGVIKSPRNIFLYGRGGAANLSCVFRIEAGSGERVRLTVHNASFGETDCVADRDPHTGRQVCVKQPGSRVVELQVSDVPWKDVKVLINTPDQETNELMMLMVK